MGARDIGLFDDRRRAFLETLSHLRPRLHRYCARMTGSAMDGEDVMQDATFEAYRKLDSCDPARPLAPWVFGIAHNRCIDFLRRRNARSTAECEMGPLEEGFAKPVEPIGHALENAFERLVIHLPPKERACVLLKDVLDYSLEEIAGLVSSTVGGVKAALSRGRGKLQGLQVRPTPRRGAANAESLQLLRLYVDRFNRRDWDGVRELTSADARLVVVDRFAGNLDDPACPVETGRPAAPWQTSPGEVDGEVSLVALHPDPSEPTPLSAIRLRVAGDPVQSITESIECPRLLASAGAVVVAGMD